MITHYIIEVTDHNGVKSVVRESSEGSPSTGEVSYWEDYHRNELLAATVINVFTTED